MFFFSKPKKEEPKKEKLIVDNPVLGKMEHIYYGWWSLDRIDVFMFGKTYSVEYVAASNKNKEFPNSKQEDAFKKIMAEKEKWQVDVEQAVFGEIKLDPSLEYKDVINVEGIHISRDGAYGISMAISDDYSDLLDELDILPHNIFGVSVFPELYVIKCEDDFDQIFMYSN